MAQVVEVPNGEADVEQLQLIRLDRRMTDTKREIDLANQQHATLLIHLEEVEVMRKWVVQHHSDLSDDLRKLSTKLVELKNARKRDRSEYDDLQRVYVRLHPHGFGGNKFGLGRMPPVQDAKARAQAEEERKKLEQGDTTERMLREIHKENQKLKQDSKE
jgi:hypothetical protein